MLMVAAVGRKINKADNSGLCYGVKRAIAVVERICRERGMVETLGVEVHNRQLQQKLTDIGVRVASSVDDVRGDTVVISTHGISPDLEEELKRRNYQVVDTTCPIVHRAQVAASNLAEAGFSVVIYGDADHPEVKGILGWAKGKGIATVNPGLIKDVGSPPSRLGIVAQTTQIAANFNAFVSEITTGCLDNNSDLRVRDTICQYIKERQASALKLAQGVDLMVIIGGCNSANTKRLVELCSIVTETYQVETAGEIQPSWLSGKSNIGVAGGASTSEQTIDDVITTLETMD